ncbi:gamma-tubulin complex component 2 [Camelus ferus]|nr:gamma-tubulin complex component 2 [Camelus ferus]
MSEFRIHHDVNELLSLLRVRGGDGAEVYIDLLQKNRTPYVTTTVSAHSAKTLQYLQQNARERAEFAASTATSGTTNFNAPATASKISMQELEELRKQLGSVATGPTWQQVSSSICLPRPSCQQPDGVATAVLTSPALTQGLDIEATGTGGSHAAAFAGSLSPVLRSGTLPLTSQESAVVEDLLYVLVGVDGRELVNRILPVAASYSTVTRFIEEKSSFEYGQVNHALAAAMRTLVKEYLILVTQLEQLQRQGLLSLQKLWFYVQPAMRTVDILASLEAVRLRVCPQKKACLCEEVGGECVGGSTLSLLHDRSFSYTGDSQAQELCLYLTKAASVPYFEILEKWIYRGVINDPYSEVGRSTSPRSREIPAPRPGWTAASAVLLGRVQPRSQQAPVLCSEFMVEEHELQKEKIQEDYNDKYWDQRYTVVQRQIPSFLQKMAGKVLSTGKYLNVVRECGHDVTCPVAKEVIYTLKERAYVEQIEKAFNYASKVLLDFLMEEKELVAHLSFLSGATSPLLGPLPSWSPICSTRTFWQHLLLHSPVQSIKRYFLMDQGDFFVHFMDLTEEELKKPVDDITPTRLEALLELALRMSTANTDPFKDDLKIDLMPHDLITQLLRVLAIETKQEKAMVHADPTELSLTGLEAFSFDYVVKWPLSLIINRKALTRYQMLFRHMFYCKHVERQLCNVWVSNKAAKQCSLHSAKWMAGCLASGVAEPVFAGAFTLRQRMLNFVQNIQYYMMFEVMEPTWHVLEKNLKSLPRRHQSIASNIDDVLGHHAGFLDSCLKDCMLTTPALLRAFSKLMSVCVMFTNCMQSMKVDSELGGLALERSAVPGPPVEEAEHPEERARRELARKCLAEHVDTPQLASSFEATISKFDQNFSAHLLDLLAQLSLYSTSDCEHGMASVISRLDFNGFYTERLERLSAERSQKAAPAAPVPRGPPAPTPRIAVTAQ